MQRILKNIGLAVGLLLFVVIFTVWATFEILQTPSGKQKLVQLIEDASESGGQPVKIGSFDGDFPSSIILTNLLVSDIEGIWLQIDRLEFRWNPWDLLKSKVKIREISLQTVDLFRKPINKEPTVEEIPNEKAGELPVLPIAIEVDHIGAQKIRLGEKVLGEKVLGESVSLSFESQLAYLGLSQGLSVMLDVKRIDQTPGSLMLTASFIPPTKNLTINLDAQEPEGGILVRALNIPDLPEMSARINGEGNLENWKSQFDFRAGDYIKTDGTAQIMTVGSDQYSLDLFMKTKLSPLVAPDFTDIIKDPVTLATNLVFDSPEKLNIKSFDISNHAFQVGLKGNVHIQDQKLDLRYSLIPKNDQLYQSLAPGVRWKSLKVSGTTKGLMNQPDIGLKLEAVSLAQKEISVPLTKVNFSVSPDRPFDQKGVTLGITGNGFISQPKGLGPEVEQLISDKLKWKLATSVNLDQQKIDLKQFETSIQNLTLSLKGILDQWGQKANINLQINSPDLSAFSEIAKTKIAGNLNVGLDIAAQEFGQIVQAKILTKVQNLETEFPEVKVIVGDQIKLTGVVRRNKEGMTEVEALKFNGSAVSGILNASLRNDQTVNTDWYILFPRISELSEIAKKELSGKLAISGIATGAMNSPNITTKIESKNLIVDGLPVDEAQLNLTVANLLNQPSGTLSTKVSLNEIDASTSTEFVMQSDNLLKLNKILVQGLGTEIGGDIQVNLKPVSLTGDLNGKIHEYDSINDLLGQELSANTRFGVNFNNDSGQAVKLTANVENFKLNGETPLAVKSINLTGEVGNALDDPQIKSQLNISEANHPKAKLKKMVLKTQGSPEAMEYDLMAVLDQGLSAKLNTTGKLSNQGETKKLALKTLSGSVGDIPFKMTEPSLLAISGSNIELKKFILKIKDGLVSSNFKKNSTGMFADLSLDDFPLDLVNKVQPGLGVDGVLKGKASLSAKMDDPQGNLDFTVNDLVFAEVSKKGLSPASVNLKGNWKDSLASVNLLLTQPSVGDFKVNGEVPLVMDQDTQGIKVPANSPLKATAEGQVVLDILNNILMASGNQIKGKMDLKVKVGGVLEKPEVAGTLNLLEGNFENLTAGTTLNDISIKTAFDNNHLKLDTFNAKTPGDGSLSANGTIKKSGEDDFVADLKFSTDSAKLVSIDTVTAEITSDLHLSGPLKSALLKGKINIDHADIYVPNALPPSVVVLDVEEAEEVPASGEIKIESDKKKEEEIVLGLDLNISAPGEIFIRGRGVDAQLEGDLKVTGTSKKPSVDGAFKMRRGTLEILSRKVKFKQGVVGFDGVPDRDPDLDFKAEIPTKNITIIVAVLGAVSNPKIKLTSNPEKPQDEILSNLLFDKSAGAMTPFEAVQLANSAAQLAGMGGQGPGFMDNIRGSLGLDTLKFSGGDSGPGVEAGSYVADGVYVGVKQGLGENSSAAVIEYEVTPNVTVESDIGADSESRLGVKMEWDY
jgi:translocation and assembly module TamB